MSDTKTTNSAGKEQPKSFGDFQRSIIGYVNDACNEVRKRLWSLSFFSHVFYSIIGLLAFGVFLLVITPKIWNLSTAFVVSFFSADTSLFPAILFGRLVVVVLAIAIWLITTYGPYHLLMMNLNKHKQVKEVISLTQVFFIIPSTVIIIDMILVYYFDIGTPIVVSSLQYYIAILLILDILALFGTFVFALFASSTSNLLILFLSHPAPRKDPKFFLSHDQLVTYVEARFDDEIRCYSEEKLRQILHRVQYKSEGLSRQVDAIGPIFGIFGLFSLFALIYTQDDVRSTLELLDELFSVISSGTGQAAITLSLIMVVILLILSGCRYLARHFYTQRILEIAQIICDNRLEDMAQQRAEEEAARQQVALVQQPVVRQSHTNWLNWFGWFRQN